MEDDILESHPVNVQIILRNGILPTLLDVVSSTVDVDLISEYSGASPPPSFHPSVAPRGR